MIGKETVHATDPAATVACSTCHTAHYEDLGTCATCHGGHAETHHGTATLAVSKLTLGATPRIVKAHAKVKLSGRLLAGSRGLASQTITIQRSVGGAYKNVGVAKTRADGSFSRTVKPGATTRYRAVWRPAGAYVTQQMPAVITITLKVRK
jgi:hypothetical protein